MNNEGVLVIGGSIVLALVGFGFKYAQDNPTQKKGGGVKTPLVTWEKKDLRVPSVLPMGNQDMQHTTIKNATAVELVRHQLQLNEWAFDEATVKAMLYTMQRIVNSANWFDSVKEKANNKNRSVDYQLFKDARYVLEDEGLKLKDYPVHITHQTGQRYMNAIYEKQINDFTLEVINNTL